MLVPVHETYFFIKVNETNPMGCDSVTYVYTKFTSSDIDFTRRACIGIIYPHSTLNFLKCTTNFADHTIEHIFEGQILKNGKAVGYHYEGINETSGKVILGSERTIDEIDVYMAHVEVNGLYKTSNNGFSAFFTKAMSPQQIVNSINETYSNCT